jgi:radical SAM protein with 4Fe4S-binding SPASM domain
MYSNGAFPNRLFKFIDRFKNKKHKNERIKKWRFQISYDGNPIHDLCRRTVSGKHTSHLIKKTIMDLTEKGHDVVIKGTCPVTMFKYLPSAWADALNLFNESGGKITYAVTVDYHEGISEEQLKEAENSILKIARYEKEFHKVHGKFLSNFFTPNRMFCSSGRNMLCIDVDGQVYFCHGAMYHDCNELNYTSIYDDSFLEKVKQKYESIPIPEETDECIDCIASMCLRCNVMKYVNSKKDSLEERFNDWTCQPQQCKYYKMVGRISVALFQILEEEKQNAMRM